MRRVPIDPFAPAPLGRLTLRNRFIKAATFEGLGEGHLVSERLIDFHRTMARGGLGMTTMAYLAVSEDGQGAPNEIVVRPEALPGLRRIADAVHAEGAAISAQIGHAGPVSASIGRKALAPSRQFSPMSFWLTSICPEGPAMRFASTYAPIRRSVLRQSFCS